MANCAINVPVVPQETLLKSERSSLHLSHFPPSHRVDGFARILRRWQSIQFVEISLGIRSKLQSLG
ncbi:Uncharacterised protein [Vibrio cholerae]|nr:Uncharacterised protein [Vibrio cholerae]